ncbi:MAG: hypothetical protein IJN19_04375 [Opitutales bacterium]|nr:hypothetical protein [Opitutales bacterium]
MLKKIFTLLVASSALTHGIYAGTPRSELWVDAAVAHAENRPQDMISALEKIAPLAADAQSWSEYALAAEMCAAAKAVIAGKDAALARVRALREALALAPSPEAKIFLEAKLAWALLDFSQSYRRGTLRGNDDAEPAAELPENIAEWSDTQLRDAAVSHYENVLSQSDLLKKIPVAAVKAQLKLDDKKVPGKTKINGHVFFPEIGLKKSDELGIFSIFNTPEAEYPTLYDFIAADAVKFFTHKAGHQDILKISETAPFFAETEEFLDYDPSGVPVSQDAVRAVQILQDLTRFHVNDADKTALARATLSRYACANRHIEDEAKAKSLNEAYEGALKKFIADYAYFPISAEASAKLAEFYVSEEREPEAYEVADRAVEKYGESPYASECYEILEMLKRKNLSFAFQTKYYLHSAPTKIDFSAKNVSKMRLRAVPANWRDYLKKEHNKPTNLSQKEIRELLESENFTERTFPIEQFHDFRSHKYSVELPAGTLAPGFYFFFFAAEDQPFSPENHKYSSSVLPVWVSDIAVVTESRYGNDNTSLVRSDGTLPVRVVHALTGKPIAGAVVSAWNKARWGGERISVPSVQTDELGEAVISGLKKDRDPIVLVEYEIPAAAGAGTPQKHAVSVSSLNHLSAEKPQPEPNRHCISLFADRPIFRPAQKISFKGILTHDGKTENGDATVVPGKKAEISLINSNTDQVVAKTEAWSNGFGSFAGTLDIPRDLALGHYILKAESDGFNAARTFLRIEEYRRPKSELSVREADQPQALGQRAYAVISGKSFTGAPLDGAKVHWKVEKTTYPTNVIAEGDGVLAADGTLKISWETEREHLRLSEYERKHLSPEEIRERENNATRHFRISAEIVDNNGETLVREHLVWLRNASVLLDVSANKQRAAGTDVPVFCSVSGNAATSRNVLIEVFRLVEPESAESEQNDDAIRAFYNRTRLKTGEKVYTAPAVAEARKADATEKAAPALTVPAEKLAPGRYRVSISGTDDFGQKITDTCEFTVLDSDATEFALRKKFLLEKLSDDNALKPGSSAEILWGSGLKNARAFVEIFENETKKRISAFYTNEGQSQQKISVPVTEEMCGKRFSVCVTQITAHNAFFRKAEFAVPASKPKNAPAGKHLKIEPVRFEKTLTPGNAEVWTFKVLRDDDSPAVSTEVLASLYDCSASANFYLSPWRLSSAPRMWRSSPELARAFSVFGDGRYFHFSPSFGFSGVSGDRIYPYRAPGWVFEPERHGGFYGAVPVAMTANHVKMAPRGGMLAGGSSGFGGGSAGGIGMSQTVDCDEAVAESAPSAPQAALAKNKYAFTSENGDEIYAASLRKNLQETAFFYPFLQTDENGIVTLQFVAPEALTRWRLRIFAHDKELRAGTFSDDKIFTSKDLMIQPDAPRFLREGDEIKFPVKITNRGNAEMTGTLRLETEFLSADGKKIAVSDESAAEQNFTVPAQSSATFFREIRVPLGAVAMNFRATGSSGEISDGESAALPVLPREIVLTESRAALVRPGAESALAFDKLAAATDGKDAPRSRAFLLDAPRSAYEAALLALPYIAEQAQECESSDSIFYRLYTNALAKSICDSAPQLREKFEQWRITAPEKFDSTLASAENSPYTGIAQSESAQRRAVGSFFEPNKITSEIGRALATLRERLKENNDQGWSWFPDSRFGANTHITREILLGLGRLRERVADADLRNQIENLARNPLAAQDAWLQECFNGNGNNPLKIDGVTLAQYLYMRSLFSDENAFPQTAQSAWKHYFDEAKRPELWAKLPRMAQAQIALALWRNGEKDVSAKIVESLRQRAISDEQVGMYWNDLPTLPLWLPQYSPIETQAAMIEAFSEIAKNEKAVEEMKIWLLTRKQTHAWNSSRASANALFALLRENGNASATDAPETTAPVPAKVFAPANVKFSDATEKTLTPGTLAPSPALAAITAKNNGDAPAFVSAHWTFSQPLSAVVADAPANGFSVKKAVFKRERSRNGKYKLTPARLEILKPGDEILVRLTVRADRDFEFVCLKDFRASGCEPAEALSGWKNNNALWFYGEPRDSETRFFFDRLPAGTHVFEYSQRVRTSGLYSSGFAEIRSLYAPEFSAHSSSEPLVSM